MGLVGGTANTRNLMERGQATEEAIKEAFHTKSISLGTSRLSTPTHFSRSVVELRRAGTITPDVQLGAHLQVATTEQSEEKTHYR
jgi:hypothetical protein